MQISAESCFFVGFRHKGSKVLATILAILILPLAALLLTACREDPNAMPNGPVTNGKLSFVLLDFDGDAPTPYSPEAYQRALFDPSYTQTPERPALREGDSRGEPLPATGSVREYFRRISKDRFLLEEGTNYGRIHLRGVTWNSIEAAVSERSATGWYVPPVYSLVEAALARGGHNLAPGEHLLILINHDFRGCASGGNIYLPATATSGYLQLTGLLAHEIGHIFLYQPDRYNTELGGLGPWDVMADQYANSPPGFSGQGMVDARWAHYLPNEVLPNNPTQLPNISLPALPETTEIPTYPSRLGLAANQGSFFSLEFRSRDAGREANSSLPNSGVLLFENDPWGMRGTSFYLGLYDQLIGMEMYFLQTKSVLDDLVNFSSQKDAWSRPFSGNSVIRPHAGFNCEDGSSLNVLGECLWSFPVVTLTPPAFNDSVQDSERFRDPHARVEISSHVLEVAPQPLLGGGVAFTLPTANFTPYRAYLTGLATGQRVRLMSATRGNLGESIVETRDGVWVSDLDDLPEGGRLQVTGSGESHPKLQLVARSGVRPQHQLLRRTISLRTGEQWASAVFELRSSQTNTLTIPLLPEWRAQSGNTLQGVLRVIAALDTNSGTALPPPTEYEGIRAVYCTSGSPPNASCGSLIARKFLANRQAPVVFLVPIYKSVRDQFTGELLPEEPIQVVFTRELAGTADRLWILAADFMWTPPSPTRAAQILSAQSAATFSSFFSPEPESLPACTLPFENP